MEEYEYYPSDETFDEVFGQVLARHAIDADDGIVPMMRDAFAAGFDAGSREIQYEWDLAEELRAESRAGWDW